MSGVKVFSPGMWRGEASDRELSLTLSITDVEESNKLVILARRWAPFDTMDLGTRLSAIAARTHPSDRINAVINTVVAEAPGYLDYFFLTKKGSRKCPQHDVSQR